MKKQTEKKCGYCFNRNPGNHFVGCPILASDYSAENEWLEGWKHGFLGIIVEMDSLTNKSPSWQVGYRVGHIELNQFIEAPLKTGRVNFKIF
jgi:hypothetical protein